MSTWAPGSDPDKNTPDGTQPPDTPAPDGTFFDGHSPRKHDVDLALSEVDRQLRISAPTLDTDHYWPLDDIRQHRDHAHKGVSVFGCPQESDARLTISEPEVLLQLRALCPNLSRRDVHRGAYRKVAFWGIGAVASVLLIVFVIIPALAGTLAKMLPVEREVALGNTVMRQLEKFLGSETAGDLTCSSPDGDRALQKMALRLSDQIDSPYDLRIRVLDHKMINAFAVPGGNIVLFDGLIQDATSPEMVAGVLAHEFGHVIHRDSTRLMLQTAGSAGILGMLLGDFAGGAAVLLVSDQLITANYQQEAESNADSFAHDILASARLPSEPLADFFLRIKEEYGEVDGFLSHLVSHPDLDGRAKAAVSADTVGTASFSPVLTAQEWVALREICSDR
jgi:Zn-dependent protease with chaperone function